MTKRSVSINHGLRFTARRSACNINSLMSVAGNTRGWVLAGVLILVIPGLIHQPEAEAAEAAPVSAPRVFLWDGAYISKTRLRIWTGDTNFGPALAALEGDARETLKAGPFSVMEKSS